MSESHPGARTPPASGDELAPLAVPTTRIVEWGLGAWAILLVVTLAVPTLHQDERSWWPWTCVAALVLGLLGYAYVRRGRGNAHDAG